MSLQVGSIFFDDELPSALKFTKLYPHSDIKAELASELAISSEQICLSTVSSLSINMIYFPEAAAIPVFLAEDTPPFGLEMS